jgi:stage III sporulation protein AG
MGKENCCMDQFKKLTEKLKNLLETKNRKKLIENSVIAIIIGIILIITASTLLGGSSKKNTVAESDKKSGTELVSRNIIQDDSSTLKRELETILSQVSGAGRVTVMITYESGKESVPATDVKRTDNTTNEKDTSGGTRDITDNDFESKVVYEEQQGTKKPVILKEIQPKVKGAVIVADGADDPVVRENICNAARVLLDVELHKIQVIQRSKQ